jgi:NAD+ synthase (glutamine-hydrolysing)
MTDWKIMTDTSSPDNPLNITLVQQNYLLADLAGNAAQILAAVHSVEQQHPHSLIVFPELSLTGYPPEDLLLRPEFLQNTQQTLLNLAQQIQSSYVVVGLPLLSQGQLYNMACVLHDGQVIAQYGKQHLPNYSVFDEKRYFTAADQPCVLDIQGYRIGLTICEDLWQPGPLSQAAQAGAELILCLNASPFHLHKPKERVAALRKRQQAEGQLPIVYVNMVGGQDELVFDGGSMVIDAQGQVAAQCDYFVTDQLTVTFSARQGIGTDRALPSPSSATGDIYQALTLGIRDYVRKNNFANVVLGLSGGIDSALTLAIAVDALGAQHVHAIMLPSRYTSDMSVEDAKLLSEQAGVSYDIISIEPAFQTLLTSLDDMFVGAAIDVTEENLQSRCRAALLMAISNKFGWLVLNTGNKSEMAVGYATLYGDMAGAFAVLKDVPKTLVYELAHYRNQQSPLIPSRIIERPPSAELAVDQVDQDWLPPYAILDPIIMHYVEHNRSIDDIVAQGFDLATVQYVVHLIQRNEYKRRQAPGGVKISQRAFGRDWRVPITAFY